MSKKLSRKKREEIEKSIVKARSGGRCEIREPTLGRCISAADEVHHAFGGSDRKNGTSHDMLHICRGHHDAFHAKEFGEAHQWEQVAHTFDALGERETATRCYEKAKWSETGARLDAMRAGGAR